MQYSIIFLEKDYQSLIDHLFRVDVEQGAYALCRISVGKNETRFLIQKIIPVSDEHIELATATQLKIRSDSYVPVFKKANDQKQSFIFIHSHPPHAENFSTQDDREESKLFKTAHTRIHTSSPHASIVIANKNNPVARVWLDNGSFSMVAKISVIGKRFNFIFKEKLKNQDFGIFDRQIRAFGPDLQPLLKQLNVGVIGVGGTGSCVVELLSRLGIGTITIADGQTFDPTNINRVYGSTMKDKGIKKVDIAERSINQIGLSTVVRKCDLPITYPSTIKLIKECDVIFGCTDDHWGRSILNKLAIYYYIPVFDMGVRIDSKDGTVKSIQGRVTTLLPGEACLFCRDRISSKMIDAESKSELDPTKYNELVKEGYIPELNDPAPSVIPFTTGIASSAVSEFLNRITGFMGSDRSSSEVLFLFDDMRIRTNKPSPRADCFCSDPHLFGRGDCNPLLDIIWRKE